MLSISTSLRIPSILSILKFVPSSAVFFVESGVFIVEFTDEYLLDEFNDVLSRVDAMVTGNTCFFKFERLLIDE